MGVMPGISCVSAVKLRKFDGTSSISRLDRLPPIWLLVFCTSGACPVTSTASLSPATCIFTSSVIIDPAVRTTSVCLMAPNPVISTTSVNTPGSRLGIEYAPVLAVTTVRVNPVCCSVIVTVAPGKSRPSGSSTFPEMAPRCCANAGDRAAVKMDALRRTRRATESMGSLFSMPFR